MSVGERIRLKRKQKSMTLEELSRFVGVSRQTLSRYENNIIAVPSDRMELVATALDTTPAYLMGWDDEGLSYKGILPIKTKSVPMLGEIACGDPIYASEEHESYAAADSELDADSCLRAHGDSMTGARIFDGDIVFIRSQNAVDNGEIAAVIIDDEATLKRVYFYPDQQKLILTPENPKYAPLVYFGDELETIKIIGKAVAFQSSVI